MNKTLRQLVSELPEIYQTIYGHPEWAQDVSRDCFIRVKTLSKLCFQLQKKLGRPLRILDLGCAQGFFSLSLAAQGAIVLGIDIQKENIELCIALSKENPKLRVSFKQKRIEDVILNLKENYYDLAIGLSVFHHIIHLHGIMQVKSWLNKLADCTEAIILELALYKEPLYWGPSQPKDPRELISICAFYHEIGSFSTHLSDIQRPLYIVSNKRIILDSHCETFKTWSDCPYPEANGVHKGSRRYYFSNNFFCKVINFNLIGWGLSSIEDRRNRSELQREINFLLHPPINFKAPICLGYKEGINDGWLMVSPISGQLLYNKLIKQEFVDKEVLLDTLLQQLIILEQAGLYHDDLRTWNIIVNERSEACLIDLGSISSRKTDCVWPHDPYQSLLILVNEIFSLPEKNISLLRPFMLSPFNLPHPYLEWLFSLWNLSQSKWNFSTIYHLFKEKKNFPLTLPGLNGINRWVGLIESKLHELQIHLMHQENDIQGRLKKIEKDLSKIKSIGIEHVSQMSTRSINDSTIREKIIIPRKEFKKFNEIKKTETRYLSPEDTRLNNNLLMSLLREWKIGLAKDKKIILKIKKIKKILQGNNKIRYLVKILKQTYHANHLITSSIYYIKKYVNFFINYRLKKYIKSLVVNLIKIVIIIMHRCPALKKQIKNILFKYEIYPKVMRIYNRLYDQYLEKNNKDDDNNIKLASKLTDLNTVPCQVKKFFYQLSDKNKR